MERRPGDREKERPFKHPEGILCLFSFSNDQMELTLTASKRIIFTLPFP